MLTRSNHRKHEPERVVYEAAGNLLSRLTQPPFLAEHAANNVAPAWSPDERYILFLSDREGAWRLYRMNADGSTQAAFLPGTLGSQPLRYDFAAEHMLNWGR